MANKGYIKEMNYGKVTIVENSEQQWAVINEEGDIIVPFGKYTYIDGFESGLARVHTAGDSARKIDVKSIEFLNYKKSEGLGEDFSLEDFICQDRKKNPDKYAKWGIINEKGEEVLPVIYDDVWKFFGKNRYSTKVVKDGKSFNVRFVDLNPSLSDSETCSSSSYNNMDYGTHYGEYAGSYAQDVMGYSDDVINDAFDGDPDAYWNID